MHIGVFGGSFDPVHAGHLAAATTAIEVLGLDRLLIVPVFRQPFKQNEVITSAADRLAMLRIAFDEVPRCVVDEVEVERGGVSYTAETLRQLRTRFPHDKLSLIVGADNAAQLGNWRDAATIRRIATVVVVTRPGETVADSADFTVVPIPPHDVSASEIRATLRAGGSVEGMVPPEVLGYIYERGLYEVGV
jgi:nicotinate-nucleotide adenylyltransferase